MKLHQLGGILLAATFAAMTGALVAWLNRVTL